MLKRGTELDGMYMSVYKDPPVLDIKGDKERKHINGFPYYELKKTVGSGRDSTTSKTLPEPYIINPTSGLGSLSETAEIKYN